MHAASTHSSRVVVLCRRSRSASSQFLVTLIAPSGVCIKCESALLPQTYERPSKFKLWDNVVCDKTQWISSSRFSDGSRRSSLISSEIHRGLYLYRGLPVDEAGSRNGVYSTEDPQPIQQGPSARSKISGREHLQSSLISSGFCSVACNVLVTYSTKIHSETIP